MPVIPEEQIEARNRELLRLREENRRLRAALEMRHATERIIQRTQVEQDDDPGHPASRPYDVEKWEIRERRDYWARIGLYDTREEAEAALKSKVASCIV